MTEAGQPLIQIQDMTKVFYTDEIETHALSGIHLSINKRQSTWPCRALRTAASRLCYRSLGFWIPRLPGAIR